MKIRQVFIIEKKNIENTCYSFRTYCNEFLKNMSQDPDITELKIENFTDTYLTLSYLMEVDSDCF